MKPFTAKGKPSPFELLSRVAIGGLNSAPKEKLGEFTIREANVVLSKRNLKHWQLYTSQAERQHK